MIYVGQFEICAPNVYEYSLVVVIAALIGRWSNVEMEQKSRKPATLNDDEDDDDAFALVK